MDTDILKRKEDYRRILGDFRLGKIDILVGTQMIAKGLHFPNVTLVGIIYADLSLHIPDFRAGERTFQLITQVAGRAGRGDIEGEVFVQSFTPHHPAIQFARRHDFEGFYEQEIDQRRGEVIRIAPKRVKVFGWVDLAGLNGKSVVFDKCDAVLNCIAYDSTKDRLFVTGKLWPEISEIKLVRKSH